MPSSVPECSDSHELETLMPPGSHERGHLLEEASEEQSLMGSANQREEEDAPAPDPKVSVRKIHLTGSILPAPASHVNNNKYNNKL